jgi:hypothetical protein
MDEDELIEVSPRHTVRLAHEYLHLVKKAPRRDFVIRTISRREANGMPLMSADIVIAGEEAREQFPVAARYPLHFRKTYYPGRLHGDPKEEFERQAEASRLVGLPPPIGYTNETFRSCLLPGTPYNRLSPFGVEPEDANLSRARELPLAAAAGLWRLLEEAFTKLGALHAGGVAHGDAELHNFIVCPSPLEILMVDFEAAVTRSGVGDPAFEREVHKDFAPLLREAIFLECSLGQQPGALAEMAEARLGESFKHPERFQREIDRKTTQPA